ncbi:MAG: TetR/AcrR family transcriptional regulator [Betaproteobacteria bacterium]
MAEKKRPRRTRERILETSLALFNRFGEPHVTTADIADEMNISPGNLYYHFRNKDEIIGELFAAYEQQVLPLLVAPGSGGPPRADVEDLWLLLHLLFERMWAHRFLYRDLDELASRNRRLGARFGELLRRGATTVVELCRGMVAAGSMRASEPEIAAVAQNVVLVATYWLSFQRLSRAAREPADEADLPRGAYQVLALVSPYLVGDARALLDRLGADYL